MPVYSTDSRSARRTPVTVQVLRRVDEAVAVGVGAGLAGRLVRFALSEEHVAVNVAHIFTLSEAMSVLTIAPLVLATNAYLSTRSDVIS